MKGVGKQYGLAIFTIQDIILPKQNNDLYQVQWKRGAHEGFTEKVVSNDGIAFFGNKYRFNVTFYFTNKKNYKPKILEIKIFVYKNGIGTNRKVLGKLFIDLTNYISNNRPETASFLLESPHRKKTTLNMIILVKLVDSFSALTSSLETNASLSSISDATMLTSDRESSWDVSSILSSEDESRIKKFFKTREESKKQYECSLQNFIKDASQKKTLRSKYKNQETKLPPLINELSKTEVSPTQKINSFLFPNIQNKAHAKKSKSGTFLTFQAVTNLLNLILSYSWDRTPIHIDPYPKASSVMYGFLLYTKILNEYAINESFFKSLSQTFFDELDKQKFIFNCSKSDNFLVLIHFLALLNIPSGFDARRLAIFNSNIFEKAKQSFYEFVSSLIDTNMHLFIEKLFQPKFDVNKILELFHMEFSNISQRENFNQEILNYVIEYAIILLDFNLLNYLINHPDICTFSNSMAWNSLVTSISTSNQKIEFKLFREANSILMMAQSVCTTPTICKEIAPNLPKEVILKLLKNQKTDEFLLEPNNTKIYEEFYEKELHEECHSLKPPNFDAIGEIVSIINTKKWNMQTFTERDYSNFPFLQTIFPSELNGS